MLTSAPPRNATIPASQDPPTRRNLAATRWRGPRWRTAGLGGERAHAPESLLRIAREPAKDHVVESLGDPRVSGAGRRRDCRAHGLNQLVEAVGLERRATHDALIEHGRERILVALRRRELPPIVCSGAM